jgi:predicted membrane protein
MAEENVRKIKIEQHSFMVGAWCASWLFTVGFLHLGFWKIVLAFVIWPYYIGVRVSAVVQ